MKRNPLPLLLLVIAVVLGLGLLLSGCNRNQARETDAPAALDAVETAESTTAPVIEEQALARREEELDRVEQVLNERVRGIEARVEAVEKREAALARREAALAPPASESWADVEEEPGPRVVVLELPAATELELEIEDRISSETSLVGDLVRAAVVRDVVQDGLVAIPAGSRVFGAVAGAVREKRIAGQALLSLDFAEIETPSGERVAIRAFLDAEGRNQKKKDAATIGGSAAGGAVLGRILSKDDKTKGTVIGAVLGAAVGTAVASRNQGDPVVIEPGTVFSVQLAAPVAVAVAVHEATDLLAEN